VPVVLELPAQLGDPLGRPHSSSVAAGSSIRARS
jgi:hypothetical protein